MNQAASQVIVVRSEKSVGIAYALLIFFGQLGLHRFYLNRVASGIAQATLAIIGWATVVFFVGLLFLIPLWIWVIADLFLTAGMVRQANMQSTHNVAG